MARYVIDAATLVHLVTSGAAIDAGHQLVAPNAIRSQAMALLLAEVRAGRLTEAEALARHERITELKMRLLGDRVSRRTAWNIARDHAAALPAAEYVAVCRLQADALVTVDDALAELADGIVALAPLDALGVPGPAITL